MKDTKKTMQNRIITSKGTFLFVEVPDDVTNFIVEEFHINRTSLSFVSEKEDLQYIINLYGICSKIATTKDITEVQAESIVDSDETEGSDIFGIRLRYYIDYNNKENILIEEAKESLQSLLEAHGLDNTKNYLILKKLNDSN